MEAGPESLILRRSTRRPDLEQRSLDGGHRALVGLQGPDAGSPASAGGERPHHAGKLYGWAIELIKACIHAGGDDEEDLRIMLALEEDTGAGPPELDL